MLPELLSDDAKGFSLVLGGPIYQFFLRIGLVKPPLNRVGWRMAVISMTAWLPLLILTILSGRFMGGVKIPFLYDYEVHCRLLLTIPLLIGAELTIHKRILGILRQFVDRQIVGRDVLPEFAGTLQSAVRLRNSTAVELGMVAIVFIGGSFIWRGVSALPSDTWYGSMTAAGTSLEPAGYWYQFVSVPITQFIGLRWYFRLFIWARLLFQISRLDLNLVPSHPDRCCGLSFLGGVAIAMGPFLMAHSVLLAGNLANRILYGGFKLPDYKIEILTLAVLLYLLTFGPICVFTPRLSRQRIAGLYTYGALASEYVMAFEEKWMKGRRPHGEDLIGSGDIQSLADLGNSFSVVNEMRPFPFGRQALIGTAVFISLPILPLTLTMFSLQEMLARLLQVLL